MADVSHRLARWEDLLELRAMMGRAIEQLQHGFLTPEQVAVESAPIDGVRVPLLRMN